MAFRVAGGGSSSGSSSTVTDLSPAPDGTGLISGTVNLDLNGLTDVFYAAKLSGNVTIVVNNLARICSITFRIAQSAAGNNVITFQRTGGVVRWDGNTTAVLTPAGDAIDYFLGIGSPSGLHMDMFICGQDMA
jgi:hypothetical protein